VTNRELNFVIANRLGGAGSTTILALRQDGAAARPVARLLQSRAGPVLQVTVQRLPQPGTAAERAAQEMAALEQLYVLVLRQEPLARYCLADGGQACDTVRDGMSHAQVLQALAQRREQAAVGIPGAVPWRVVEMMAGPSRPWDADVAVIRAAGPQGPLADAAIYFNRMPHSICAARTRVDGVASCRLEDQHADGHQHAHGTAVVATFPGDVRPDRVLLPTTYVLPAPAGFAQPLAFPSAKPSVKP
jgi:hypothetical protein